MSWLPSPGGLPQRVVARRKLSASRVTGTVYLANSVPSSSKRVKTAVRLWTSQPTKRTIAFRPPSPTASEGNLWCGAPEPDRGLRDRGDPAPFCGANRQLPMLALSSTGWAAGRPDTTAGSQPIGVLGRPASDPPRTASLTSESPAPVPDAETLLFPVSSFFSLL